MNLISVRQALTYNQNEFSQVGTSNIIRFSRKFTDENSCSIILSYDLTEILHKSATAFVNQPFVNPECVLQYS